MDTIINYNGSLINSNQPVLTAENRGFRYGDGIFETIRVSNGRMPLGPLHFDRLFSGMELLQFERPAHFTAGMLTAQIEELCKKNGHSAAARVRLVIFRGNGGLYDPENHLPNYIIQTWPLAQGTMQLNEKGLSVAVFPDGRKTMDGYSNLKSNNYLVYAMAALYAKKHHLDDCLLLNSAGRICDSTIANIFCIKDGTVYTPPLSEGCVAGVMRSHLLQLPGKTDYPIFEKKMDEEFVQQADEVFLTNAVQGIRRVQRFGDKTYGGRISNDIFMLIRDLWE